MHIATSLARDGCSVFTAESLERAKKRKQIGLTPVRKKLVVEHHYDDLGGDLPELGNEVTSLMKDVECTSLTTNCLSTWLLSIGRSAASSGPSGVYTAKSVVEVQRHSSRPIVPAGGCALLRRKFSDGALPLCCRAPWTDGLVLEPQSPSSRGPPRICQCYGAFLSNLLDSRHVTPTYVSAG